MAKKKASKSKKPEAAKKNKFLSTLSRVLFRGTTRNMAIFSAVSLSVIFGSATGALAKLDDTTHDAIGKFAVAVVEDSIERNHGKVASKAAGEALALVNTDTDPKRCAEDTFRGTRSVEDCREDQVQARVRVYAAAGAAGALDSVVFGKDDPDTRGRRNRRPGLGL